jgi:hypothetical protein
MNLPRATVSILKVIDQAHFTNIAAMACCTPSIRAPITITQKQSTFVPGKCSQRDFKRVCEVISGTGLLAPVPVPRARWVSRAILL